MLAPILGAVCLANGTRGRTLTINGLEVLKKPGGSGHGVSFDSIRVDEAAPGSVSSMQFVVDDPLKAVTVTVGEMVRFWDHIRNVPIFTGFVDAVTLAPAFGTGRTITVSCVGLDAVLDWLRVPALTFDLTLSASSVQYQIVQALYGAAYGSSGVSLNAGFNTAGPRGGSQAFPVGDGSVCSGSTTWASTAGSSLRSAIAEFCRVTSNAYSSLFNGLSPLSYRLTVDPWGGLRFWAFYGEVGPPERVPSDYATLTVTDTAASALVSASLSHVIDGGSVIRSVWVTGGSAAGTGSVSDGSGIPGRSSSITDASITTDEAKSAAASAIFSSSVTLPRGSFQLESYTPTSVHPGSPLVLTDAQTGVSGTYAVTGIGRTFEAGTKETWTVAYGKAEPSYIDTGV